MAKKGQKLKTYSFELKKKAVEMKLQGIPHAKIAEELGIQDIGRLKIWIKKYREQGDFGEIAEVHQQLFDSLLKGSKIVGEVKDIRFLTPEIAIVHGVGAVLMRWQKKVPKRRKSINTNVVVKHNGEWKITAFHNCRIKGPNLIEKWWGTRRYTILISASKNGCL